MTFKLEYDFCGTYPVFQKTNNGRWFDYVWLIVKKNFIS